MIDRIIISAVMGVSGWHGLFPEPPPLVTPHTLRMQAKEKSISEMCDRKPKSKAAKDLCRRWRKHNA
jgi:hypothetical protein